NCSPSFSFYKAVRDFRKKYNSSVEIHHSLLIADAKAIFDKFIGDSGAQQVNLPAEATAQCRKAFLDTVGPRSPSPSHHFLLSFPSSPWNSLIIRKASTNGSSTNHTSRR